MLSEKAKNITPYTAGEQPQDKKYIKLNTNENPFAPSPKVYEALKDVNVSDLRLYPDPESIKLKTAIAQAEGVNLENVFVGNGSDEVLALAFSALFNAHGKKIVFPDITYSFYPVYCNLFDINYSTLALTEGYELCLDDYINAHDTWYKTPKNNIGKNVLQNNIGEKTPENYSGESIGGIVLANPNAPTAIAIKCGDVEKILASNRNIPVIIDEAYVDFAPEGTSALNLTKEFDNLLVVKTFSKSYGLAGIRCGYAVGNPLLIDGLNRIKNSFNSYPIDRVCETVCSAAISDRKYFNDNIEKINSLRDTVFNRLTDLGFKVTVSAANFLFVTVDDAAGAYQKLKDGGILVRYFNKPRLNNKLRITIGTVAEMNELIRQMAAL